MPNLQYYFESAATMYSWHNKYNKYDRRNFDPLTGYRLGGGIKLCSKQFQKTWLGGSCYFNYFRTYAETGAETLNFYSAQIKVGPGVDWGPVSLDFMLWYQYISGFYKNDGQPPGFGILKEKLPKHGFGMSACADIRLLGPFHLLAGYEYGITSAYEILIFGLDPYPIDKLRNHPNWFNFGVRWYFSR